MRSNNSYNLSWQPRACRIPDNPLRRSSPTSARLYVRELDRRIIEGSA